MSWLINSQTEVAAEQHEEVLHLVLTFVNSLYYYIINIPLLHDLLYIYFSCSPSSVRATEVVSNRKKTYLSLNFTAKIWESDRKWSSLRSMLIHIDPHWNNKLKSRLSAVRVNSTWSYKPETQSGCKHTLNCCHGRLRWIRETHSMYFIQLMQIRHYYLLLNTDTITDHFIFFYCSYMLNITCYI